MEKLKVGDAVLYLADDGDCGCSTITSLFRRKNNGKKAVPYAKLENGVVVRAENCMAYSDEAWELVQKEKEAEENKAKNDELKATLTVSAQAKNSEPAEIALKNSVSVACINENMSDDCCKYIIGQPLPPNYYRSEQVTKLIAKSLK